MDSDEDNVEVDEKQEVDQRDERSSYHQRHRESDSSSRHHSRRSDHRDSDRHKRFKSFRYKFLSSGKRFLSLVKGSKPADKN